jgi:hypothetical protein
MNKAELRALVEAQSKDVLVKRLPMRKDRIGNRKWWTITHGTEKVNLEKLIEERKAKQKA